MRQAIWLFGGQLMVLDCFCTSLNRCLMFRHQKIRNRVESISKVSSEHQLRRAFVERALWCVHVDEHGTCPLFLFDFVGSWLPKAVNEFLHFLDGVLGKSI